MKKAIFLLTILFSVCFMGLVYAYPEHLDNDNNKILVWGHMGRASYLLKNTVVVVSKSQETCILAAKVETAGPAVDRGDTTSRYVGTEIYAYY